MAARSFLWLHGRTSVSPKNMGVWAFRNIKQLNKALQAKQIWRLFKSTREWRDILIDKYATNYNFKQFIGRDNDPRGSNIWNGILRTKRIATSKVMWKLGNGEDTNF